MEWTIWAAALAFVLFFLYHSRVEAALGIHLDGKTLRISASVALLDGSVCLRLEGAFLPDAQGKPAPLLTLNGKPLKIPAAKRKTQKKSPGFLRAIQHLAGFYAAFHIIGAKLGYQL